MRRVDDGAGFMSSRMASKNHLELGVVVALHRSDLPSEPFMVQYQPPQSDESSDYGDIHLHGSLAAENAREHRNALFSESAGQLATAAVADL